MKANGGILTAEDFAGYHLALREPVRGTYRGFEVVSFPPPSSGGVHVLQILNILANFDLKPMDDATRVNVIAWVQQRTRVDDDGYQIYFALEVQDDEPADIRLVLDHENLADHRLRATGPEVRVIPLRHRAGGAPASGGWIEDRCQPESSSAGAGASHH